MKEVRKSSPAIVYDQTESGNIVPLTTGTFAWLALIWLAPASVVLIALPGWIIGSAFGEANVGAGVSILCGLALAMRRLFK